MAVGSAETVHSLSVWWGPAEPGRIEFYSTRPGEELGGHAIRGVVCEQFQPFEPCSFRGFRDGREVSDVDPLSVVLNSCLPTVMVRVPSNSAYTAAPVAPLRA